MLNRLAGLVNLGWTCKCNNEETNLYLYVLNKLTTGHYRAYLVDKNQKPVMFQGYGMYFATAMKDESYNSFVTKCRRDCKSFLQSYNVQCDSKTRCINVVNMSLATGHVSFVGGSICDNENNV